MNHRSDTQQTQKSIMAIILLLSLLWTGVVSISLTWNIFKTKEEFQSQAQNEALTILNKDKAFRLWGTRHGGVYVPVSEDTQPSPYLEHLEERDITSPSGKKLTLLNPAYMIRQMMDGYNQLYGTKGHITGLVLLRPENKPDAWEEVALHRIIDDGENEVSSFTMLDGKPYLRYMRPIIMEKGCEKCHGHLGFREGDIRGGVSVSVPMEQFNTRQNDQNLVLLLTHGSIWIIGLLFIGFGGKKIQDSLNETLKAETETRLLNQELETRVKERTNALKENEERLRMIVSNAPDGIVVINQFGTIDTFNESAQQIFGYSENEAIGQNITMLMPKNHANKHQSYIDNHLETGQERVIGLSREFQALHKNGNLIPVSLAVSKTIINGKLLFTSICRDLSRDKQIAADLLEAKAEAERANFAKSEFLASMSHELRTPLNSIIGFSQLLHLDKESPLSEKQKDNVNHISTAGQHLLSLINDILDLSRIETQGFSLSIETVNASKIVKNCLNLLRSTSEKYKIRVYDDLSSKEMPLLDIDPIRFQQVLMNLLSNAIKYNAAGGHVILNGEVKTNENTLYISVTDTGPGLAQNQIPYLFEPFNRLGQEAGEIEGTGIGLSITAKLVDMMHGKIGVESTLGKGSTFWIELPITPPQKD